MANKHLRYQSSRAKVECGAAESWWYQEPSGISIEVKPMEGEHIRVRIGWDSLRRALARKDKDDD